MCVQDVATSTTSTPRWLWGALWNMKARSCYVKGELQSGGQLLCQFGVGCGSVGSSQAIGARVVLWPHACTCRHLLHM